MRDWIMGRSMGLPLIEALPGKIFPQWGYNRMIKAFAKHVCDTIEAGIMANFRQAMFDLNVFGTTFTRRFIDNTDKFAAGFNNAMIKRPFLAPLPKDFFRVTDHI